MMIARHLRIEGKVQGVFYRAWTVETARTLGLSGWVRNRHDGSVEALIIGEQGPVEHLIGLCREGPPAARVTRIVENVAEIEPADGFHEQATA